MQIKFLGDTFIRTDIQNLTVEPVGVVFHNVTTEVEEEMVEGKAFKGNNKWYKSKNGDFFFWSGRAKLVGTIGQEKPFLFYRLADLNL